MKPGVKLFTIATAFAANPLGAATFTYQALEDFTDINAGEVPYYRHNIVDALAINAANESFRDKFALATLEFAESAGTYDVTITSLGEIDGDGEFRFLIDGVVVGSAVNTPTTIDFSEQQHTFENISIPEGALIGVASIAVSNGLIPENGAYAYARGRWTTLTISNDDVVVDTSIVDNSTPPVTPDPVAPVDLSISVSTTSPQVIVGEEVSYSVEVANLSTTVATNPVITLSLPQGISNISSGSCSAIDATTLTCNLAELPANDSASITITAIADTIGSKAVTAAVSADQNDDVTGNNSGSATVAVEAEVIADNTIDLQLTMSVDKEELGVGESLTYVLTVSNLHDSNTATSPSVGISLPDSLQFAMSDRCTATELSVTCDLEELSPGESTTVQFTATAVKVNSFSQLFATASSSQSESDVSNNESHLVTRVNTATIPNIVPVSQPTVTQSTPAAQPTSSGGGGAFQGIALLIFLLRSAYCRRLLRQPAK